MFQIAVMQELERLNAGACIKVTGTGALEADVVRQLQNPPQLFSKLPHNPNILS